MLSFYILGLTADKSYDIYVLISGVVLILFICIPISLYERYRQNKKTDDIIRSHKNACKQKFGHTSEKGRKVKGWSMNDSPFRDRKSGTTWSGGNIHGSMPKRGRRKGLF